MPSGTLPSWPPENGKDFIRSDDFGRMIVGLTRDLAARYPTMDFTDGVAHVFVWFDAKLSKNRRFINPRRFPTNQSFQAYLRQAVWNAARLATRQRRRREDIEALPVDRPIISAQMGPEIRVQLLEMVERLPEPHKTVFHKFFLDEEDLAMIASILGLTEEEVHRLYEEAVDMLDS